MRRYSWVVMLSLAITSGCVKIQPSEGGVRTNFIIFKGIRPKPLGPGLYLNIPSVTEVTAYSMLEGKYEMTKEATKGDEPGRDDIQLKSKDGQVVWVDCTVRYRLVKERLAVLHGTYGNAFIKIAIRPLTRALVSYKFGDLSAEEIYEGSNRQEVGVKIRDMMNKGYESTEGLKDKGIEVLEVLFRSFEFTTEYQNAIESKRLASEQRLAAIELAKKKEAEADGEKMAIIKLAEADYAKIEKQADANLYSQQQQAKGIEVVGQADAQAKTLLAAALGGGDVLVRLEFARKLSENMQVWGIPVGGNSTSVMDLSGLFGGMFPKNSNPIAAAASAPGKPHNPAEAKTGGDPTGSVDVRVPVTTKNPSENPDM